MAGNDMEIWKPAAGDAMKGYLIGSKIGFGSTGSVHLVKNKESDSEIYAVKLDATSSYLNERSAYTLLGAVSPQATFPTHIPRVHSFAKCGQNNAMIMDLMGPSLSNLFVLNAKRFSLKTVVQIAKQMFDCIEYVHSKDLIHRDIKPSNFAIGRHDKNQIFLIDLGLKLSDHLLHLENNYAFWFGHSIHRPNYEATFRFSDYPRRGTPAFMSLNVHKNCRPSRRDDMESIMYTLIYFLSPSLIKQESAYRQYKEQSEKIICKDLPPEIENCLTNIRALEFADTPDYDFLRNHFKQIFDENNYVDDSVYDWNN